MGNRNKVLNRLLDQAGVPQESLPGQLLLELVGSRTVHIENHRGVELYEPDRIRLATPEGYVTILGQGLAISSMSRRFAVITGTIQGLELEGNGK